MKTLSRQGIQRMTGNGGTTVVGGSGSGSGGSGGSADYAAEAGHAQTADDAIHATSADTASNLDANSTDWNKILRNDVAQTAAEVITFAKGIISTLKSYFNGGIEVTNGTKTDVLNVTGGANVGGSLAVTGNSTIGGNETVTGSVTAATLIADALKNPAFVAAVNMIGKGFGVTIDQNGKATLQTDDLLVLGQMIVNSLNIREVSYIGGTFLLTPAGSTVAKVMPLYADSTSHIQYAQYWSTTESYYQVGYRLMWKADDGTTGTMNYWNVGDMAYCHTYNITVAGEYTTEANRHYWRLVVGKGTVTISGETFHYADVADIDTVYIPNIPTAIQGRENNSGSVPAEGDKVVCLGSMTDSTRRGAVQITAEGEASIGIYDGINAYTSLSNYEIHYLSKTIVRMRSDKFTWRSSGGTLRTQANFENGIAQAGIDIDNGEINLIAGKVNFKTSGGQTNPKISIDPTTGTLNAVDGIFDGTVVAKVLKQMVCEAYPSSNEQSVNLLTIDPNGGETIYAEYYHTEFASGDASYAAVYVREHGINVGDIFYVDSTIVSAFTESNFYVNTGFATYVVITDQYYEGVKKYFPVDGTKGIIRIPKPSDCIGMVITFINVCDGRNINGNWAHGSAHIICAGHESDNLFYQSINRYPSTQQGVQSNEAVINGATWTMYVRTPGGSIPNHSINNNHCVDADNVYTRLENNVVRLYSNGKYWIVLDGRAV